MAKEFQPPTLVCLTRKQRKVVSSFLFFAFAVGTKKEFTLVTEVET